MAECCGTCRSWRNIEHTDMGICDKLHARTHEGYKPVQFVPRAFDTDPKNAETNRYFCCVHYEQHYEEEEEGIEMRLCKDCRYWKAVDAYSNRRDAGECLGLFFNGASVLDVIDERDSSDTVLCSTDVFVRQDFGCVHFEEKERGPFGIIDVTNCPVRSRLKFTSEEEMSNSVYTYTIDGEVARGIVYWLNRLWTSHNS